MSEEPPALVSLLFAICLSVTVWTIIAIVSDKPPGLRQPTPEIHEPLQE